ncbi:hypothetical protein [Prescottella defluvii]|uniref:hypothetical protein n=1 Tax=Prescottella defluvii TaxID=1323361 RepID=UPI0012E09BAA|nr:hypothetical protein [Prescottella defluvii]
MVVTHSMIQVAPAKVVRCRRVRVAEERAVDIPAPVRFGEPLTDRMEPMSLTLDAAFWRRVNADRQRVHDERERATRTGGRRPVEDDAVRAVPLSRAAAMKSARAELTAVARAAENLRGVVHP